MVQNIKKRFMLCVENRELSAASDRLKGDIGKW